MGTTDPADVVTLWYADYLDFEATELLAQFESLLNAEERDRRNRFLFERDRRGFTLSHGLLRLMLANHAGVSPAAWEFECNAYGKPHIIEPCEFRDLRFNLSHTRGAALCGISRRYEIGVDIEATDRDASCLELADRYFSPAEVEALRNLSTERQRDRFFELWTLKEAYIKARGMGLAIPLDQFSFRLSSPPGADAYVMPGISFTPPLIDSPEGWQFVERQIGPCFRAAAALQHSRNADVRWIWHKLLPTISGDVVEMP